MLIYLDSSAIVKLVLSEHESRALFDALIALPERVTSVIGAIEVARAVRRVSTSKRSSERLGNVLDSLALVELDAPVRSRAATLEPIGLRTLDAIHLSTALGLGDDLAGFVTYDERQALAASEAGLQVVSPGR